MNFIVDNYIWFIIGGAVLLLITIGYYADQTGFGKIRLKDANDDNKINDEEEDIVIQENVPINERLGINNNVITPIPDVSNQTSPNPVTDSQSDLVENISLEENLNSEIQIIPSNEDINSEIQVIPNNGDIKPEIKISPNDEDIWKF